MARLDTAVGRYLYLDIGGVEYRVYFEEAGSGIPLLLQHTAGADGRQWRHLLEDDELRRSFRMIAYDLPYHGKSLPPTSATWWSREYRLTTDFLMSVPMTLAAELELGRVVYMGSSIGGHLAVDLALNFASRLHGVIGLEAAAYTPGGYDDDTFHPQVSDSYNPAVMYGLMSPTSPGHYRRETSWVYGQAAPGIFKGDLYYYTIDHDARDSAAAIETGEVSVDILNGEYDWSAPPALGEALAAMIPGARYQTMTGLGHFPMCEDPDRFLDIIRPVLRRIQANIDSR